MHRGKEHYTEDDLCEMAQPVDDLTFRLVIKLRRGERAWLPDTPDVAQGPCTLVYLFNPYGTSVHAYQGRRLPLWALWALRAVRGLRGR